jgi:predicted nuclease of predicted toxin-antitoxin system
MLFIVDESTGAAVVEFLRSLGHDVVAVNESIPQADGSIILDWAVKEKRILITNDKDFGELVFRTGQAHHGVVLLRLHEESAANRVQMVKIILERYAERLAGHFVVASEGGISIRPADNLV